MVYVLGYAIKKIFLKKQSFLIVALLCVVYIVTTAVSSNVKSEQELRLRQIAGEYKKYEVWKNTKPVITDSAVWKWAIALCTPVTHTSSQSTVATTIDDVYHRSEADPLKSKHGNKLYKLFVKNIKSYSDTVVKNQPLGQVIIKETWSVICVGNDSISKPGLPAKKSRNDGKWYAPQAVSELFVMYKEKPNKNNDKGWVYGIVNVEDKKAGVKVLEGGSISSCITCHKNTKYDRIFGIK